MLTPHLTEVGMGARSKDFTIAFLLTALDVLVVRDNGAVVWQVWGGIPWVRFCLLLLAGVGAFTLSDVWAYAFRRSQRLATNVRTNLNSEPSVSGCAVGGPMFDSPTDLSDKLAVRGYFIDPVMTQVVYLAAKLQKPLLLEGPAGSGKTQLALSVAAAANTHVERLQCYRGVTEEKAIGQFDEGLQRLYMEFTKGQHESWQAVQGGLEGTRLLPPRTPDAGARMRTAVRPPHRRTRQGRRRF
jgi:hypothetical protein